jgi:CubicO group peptidase (beta-lactamase class C family)
MRKSTIYLLLILLICNKKSSCQSIYFPPLNNSATWDTISPASLGWCVNEIDTLYNFLQQENSKAFILLKDGKIVLEKYFGTFTKDSIWYWASAGKTITALLVGQAQEDGFLSITDSTSGYLGAGWTSCTQQQEDKIKIWNQLTMTSGLDDGVADNHCTVDSCLIYLADAGTRWAYHNAPYTLLESVLVNATGQAINAYTLSKISTPTGINGLWLTLDYDNVFFSKARNMARFGLLIQNKCIWNTDTLLHDTTYINQMTNTSQSINNSYGYLWWLNGKTSYMVPTSQIVIPGSYAPDAPADMFSGLGKNGQIVSISRSKGLVFVRMGDAPNSPASEISTIFCNQIWDKLNSIMCNVSSTNENYSSENKISVYPNPASTNINLDIAPAEDLTIEISTLLGEIMMTSHSVNNIDITSLSNGMYLITIKQNNTIYTGKFIKF